MGHEPKLLRAPPGSALGREPPIGCAKSLASPPSASGGAGRAGSGINDAELERLWLRLQPLATDKMPPLDVAPPRGSRFGSSLILSRVHWVRPDLVAGAKFLTWTEDNLLRQVVYEGLREDKPATEVRREVAAAEASSANSIREGGRARYVPPQRSPPRNSVRRRL